MFDTNQSYCRRLAQVTMFQIAQERARGPQPSQPACMQDSGQPAPNTLEARLSRFFSPDSTGSAACLASEAELAAALELRPDVQSKLTPLTEYTVSKWLLERELEASRHWQDIPNPQTGQRPDAYESARTRNASGLCLSGGGIRSATFSLGVVQGLSRLGVLGQLDYLSSVSGGGYMHQFLANWICRTGSVQAVEDLLNPIPRNTGERGSGAASERPRASVQPEPLRWLRRYSNYLAPRKGLLTLDTWTIGATWIRNTGLNLIILLSSLYCVLLLPHLGTIPCVRFEHHLKSFQIVLPSVVAVLYGLYLLWILRRCMEGLRLEQAGVLAPVLERTNVFIRASLSLLIAAVLIAPCVYWSAIPYGSMSRPEAIQIFTPAPKPEVVQYTGDFERDTPGQESVHVSVNTRASAPPSALRRYWKLRPGYFWRICYQPHVWPIASFCLYAAGLLLLILNKSKVSPWLYWLLVLVGIASAYGLVEGIRLLFFVLCFAVPPDLIPALGVVILPPLLFSVPFLLLEEMLGLLGHLTTSGQREWLARWRALSLLVGFTWIALMAFSLFGPWLFHLLAGYAKTSFTVWSAWLATTIAGVLSARNNKTSQPQEGGGTGSAVLEFATSLAPPLFVAGLLILLSTFVDWSLIVPGTIPGQSAPPLQILHRALFLFGTSFLLAVVFGWRVDINDFSMHAFYRDRIARCYAGAVDALRKPNPFTGMAPSDRSLAVHHLLPRGYHSLDPEHPAQGTYAGPYPIFCTAINLTTGEDLAYQERKAASFAFTPLFSGYSVGWTAARTATNQLNGFVDTRTYVYYKDRKESSEDVADSPTDFEAKPAVAGSRGFDGGSISVATASAISGAAASPNMGYHSNAAAAFLLTVFNVRLGWWLRNPRRREIDGCSPYLSLPDTSGSPIPIKLAPESTLPSSPWKRGFRRVRRWIPGISHPIMDCAMPSSPQVGFFSLLKELFGHSDDTTPYIYLTDGGHFDNMGLYELLRRRVRTIIVCDAESDPDLHFEGIGMAIRKARLDFGVEVTLDRTQWTDQDSDPKSDHKSDQDSGRDDSNLRRQQQPNAEEDSPGKPKSQDSAHPGQAALAERNANLPYVLAAHLSRSDPATLTGTLMRQAPPPVIEGLSSFGEFPANSIHCVHGTIRYPEDEREDQFGHILYLKASLTGDESPDILNYRMQHKSFPHDTTLNQFFTESQFESYRRLGEHIVLADKVVLAWLKRYLPPRAASV